MNIEKLKAFTKNLFKKMGQKPQDAFEFFKTEWPYFTLDERTILMRFINEIFIIRINKINEQNREISQDEFLYWLAIDVYMNKPLNGEGGFDEKDEFFPGLEIDENVKSNQIVKIFRTLKLKGHIKSSNKLIAEAISIIFPIEQSTAIKALEDSKRTDKAPDLV